MDTGYVDVNEEGLNLKAAIGSSFVTSSSSLEMLFSSLSATNAPDFVVIPELEAGSISTSRLTGDVRSSFQQYVTTGGRLVVAASGDPSTSDVLNTLFGWSLTSDSCSERSNKVSNAFGFADAPTSISDVSRMSCISVPSLPEGTTTVYASSGAASVWVVPYGSGHVVGFGPDFFEIDASWRDVVKRSTAEWYTAGQCRSGYTGPDGGPCTSCIAGKFKNSKGSANCVECEAGKHSPSAGSATCLDCAGGTTSPPGASTCQCNQGLTMIATDQTVEAAVTCVGSCPCPASASAHLGVFSDGDGNYDSDQECSWTIEASGGDITVRFPSFETEYEYDYVSIYDCANAIEGCLLDSLSGSSVPPETEFVSSTGTLSIVFKSDGSVTAPGFEAAWSIAAASEMRCLCNAGSRGPVGGPCTQCLAGKFKSEPDMAECSDCPVGTFSTAVGSTSSSTCERCPASTSSPAGSSSPSACSCRPGHSISTDGTCVACSAGKYKMEAGTSACVECGMGKYMDSLTTGATSESSCELCPANTNSNPSSTSRFSCRCNVGATGSDGGPCVQCSAGKFKENIGDAPCIDCEAGKYSQSVGSSSTCSACPDDSSSPAGSSTSTACACNAGFTGPSGGTCVQCPAGKHKAETGNSACLQCEGGKFSSTAGSTSESTCSLCPELSSSPPGSVQCVCNPGTSGPDGGPCARCEAGKFKSLAGSGACEECEEGKFSGEIGARTESTCSACPQDSLSPAASTTLNDCLCKAGATGPDGGPCSLCESGTFKEAPGTEPCLSCPVGLTSNPGATASSSCNNQCDVGSSGPDGGPCVLCTGGKFKAVLGDASCLPCSVAAGQFCPAGSPTDEGTPCPVGFYCEGGDADQQPCTALEGFYCPQGSTSAAGLACPTGFFCAGGTNDKACNAAAGSYCPPDSSSAEGSLCPAGYFCQGGGQMMKCPNGTSSMHGSDSSTDCHCSPGYTGPNGGPCLQCVTGKFKTVTDSSDCVDCGVGKFSGIQGATTCTSCPSNSNSPATSDAANKCTCNTGYSGPNGADCEACGKGKYKEASGPGTCVDCVGGKFSNAFGAESSDTCDDCGAGTYAFAGSSVCSLCPANSNSPAMSDVATECTCNMGFTGQNGAYCVQCSPGTYKEVSGSAKCVDCALGKFSSDYGASHPKRCIDCAAGSFTNSTGASACYSCGENEFTEGEGSKSRDSCICKDGFKKSCGSDVCAACDSNQLFKNGECEPCPDLSICDGSFKFSCEPGSYLSPLPAGSEREWSECLINGDCARQICVECPLGAECNSRECLLGPDCNFVSKVPGSEWEIVPAGSQGLYRYRIISCPIGFAVTRSEENSKADECAMCPPGSYNLVGSRFEPANEKAIGRYSSGVLDFCESCPLAGVKCPGGNKVEAREGWYVYADSMRRVEAAVNNTQVLVYQCPLNACGGNNTCKGNRTGTLCGYCPEGWAMELDECVSCDSVNTSGASASQIVFGIGMSILALLVLFLAGWRHVLPGTLGLHWKDVGSDRPTAGIEIQSEDLRAALHCAVQRPGQQLPPTEEGQAPASAHRWGRNLRLDKAQWEELRLQVPDLSGDDYIQVGETHFTPAAGHWIHRAFDSAMEFIIAVIVKVASRMSTETNKRLNLSPAQAIQYGKVFFGNLQVLSSFTVFKVELPSLLAGVVLQLASITAIFTFDVFSWPGMGCLTQMQYLSTLAARVLLPLLIVCLMGVPVIVSRWSLRRTFGGPNADQLTKQQRLEIMNNHEKTTDFVWNNVFTFLFLTFPGGSLSSMEPFSCRQIGNRKLLTVDLRVQCPDAADGLFWFSMASTLVWALGVPCFTLFSMRLHNIHIMAQQKRIGAIINSMIDRYRDDTVDPSRNRLANIIGNPLNCNAQTSRDLKARSDELFVHIFPEHANCQGNCAGHRLPQRMRSILKTLKSIGSRHGIGDLHESTNLNKAIMAWFQHCCRDIKNKSDWRLGVIDLLAEFTRMGMEAGEAALFLEEIKHRVHFFRNQNKEQNSVAITCCGGHTDAVAETEDELLEVHEFEDAILHELNEFASGLSCAEIIALFNEDVGFDSESFFQVILNLNRDAFKFTGTEAVNDLTLLQVHALLVHEWQRRETAADNGVFQREANSTLSSTGKLVEQVSSKFDAQFAEKKMNYKLTDSEKMKLIAIKERCETMCMNLKIVVSDLPLMEGTHENIENLPLILQALSEELDTLRKRAEAEGRIKRASSSTIDSIDHCKLELMVWNKKVRTIFLEKVIALGQRLCNERVISLPALQWDGSLGPEEETVVRRFGFLINATRVECWWWEVIEMSRKFLLTGLMVVLFHGSAPHLIGSLLVTFFFILAHLTVDPYLNAGLNDFQRLALVTQYITILGSLIYLLAGTLEELHEMKPTKESRDASRLLEIAMLLLNFIVIILYPVWNLIKYFSNSQVSLRSMVMSGFMKVIDCLSNPASKNDDEIPIERRHDNKHYLVVERFITGNQSDIEVSTPTPLAPPEPTVQLSPAVLEDTAVESAKAGSEVSRLPQAAAVSASLGFEHSGDGNTQPPALASELSDFLAKLEQESQKALSEMTALASTPQ